MTIQRFPAEDLLVNHPPNYEEQWRWIIIQAILATIFTLLIVPMIIKQLCRIKPTSIPQTEPQQKEEKEELQTNEYSKSKKKKHQRRLKKTTTIQEPTTAAVVTGSDDESVVVLHGNATIFLLLSNVMYFSFLVYLVLQSPNNVYAGRKVFVAPLFTQEECTTIIDMANQAAQRNAIQTQDKLSKVPQSPELESEVEMERYESLKKIVDIEPKGWKKDRHKSYPTTDLNVVLDFSKQEKLYLKQMFDTRLSPLIQRTYGISPDSIRANDIFIVRYDEDGQSSLGVHTDASHVSFNILLNEEFEGGGTRFHDRMVHTYMDAKPKVGQVLLNNGIVPHEGLKTTGGTRYIMVGFLSVDVRNPMTSEPSSNLSIFSSYLSLPWWLASIKMRLDGEYDRDEEEQSIALQFNTISDIVHSIQICIAYLVHIISPLEITTLVHPSTEQEFIHRLSTTENTTTNTNNAANWFAGQNLQIGLFGNFLGGWDDRDANPSAYDEI